MRKYASTFACLCLSSALALPASAGTWGTQAQLSTNAYNGTIAIDTAGNLTSLWYQSSLPNGTAVTSVPPALSTAAMAAAITDSSPHTARSGGPSMPSRSSIAR